MGNMQWVVFHSTFVSWLVRNSLLGSIWGLLKSQLRNSSTPANHYEHFQSRAEIFRTFWTLPKISEGFLKILKTHENIWKLLFNHFQSFSKISEDFQTLPKISKDFPTIFKNHKNIWKLLLNHFSLKFSRNFWRFPNTAEDFWRFPKILKNRKSIWKLLLNCFRSFPKVSLIV